MALQIDAHRIQLQAVIRENMPVALMRQVIPAERQHWHDQEPETQQALLALYRELGSQMDSLLANSPPGELLLAQLAWDHGLSRLSEPEESDTARAWDSYFALASELAQLRGRLEALERQAHLREWYPPPSSHLPALLWRLWCRVAPRWITRALVAQQVRFNVEAAALLLQLQKSLDLIELTVLSVEGTAIENDRAITDLRRRVARLERDRPERSS